MRSEVFHQPKLNWLEEAFSHTFFFSHIPVYPLKGKFFKALISRMSLQCGWRLFGLWLQENWHRSGKIVLYHLYFLVIVLASHFKESGGSRPSSSLVSENAASWCFCKIKDCEFCHNCRNSHYKNKMFHCSFVWTLQHRSQTSSTSLNRPCSRQLNSEVLQSERIQIHWPDSSTSRQIRRNVDEITISLLFIMCWYLWKSFIAPVLVNMTIEGDEHVLGQQRLVLYANTSGMAHPTQVRLLVNKYLHRLLPWSHSL